MGWVTNARGGLAITHATAEAIADALRRRFVFSDARRWVCPSRDDIIAAIIAAAKETKP